MALEPLIRACGWLTGVLTAVRDERIPDAWVGAGVLRDLVWGELFGTGFRPEHVRDVDVVFFDDGDLSRGYDERVTARLRARRPDVPWEAKNQAAVHTWYAAKFGGGPVDPFTSVADGVASWPETATAVAVRLDDRGGLVVCAPLGLDDLLGGVWRHNPRRVGPAVFRERLARIRPAERWPRVTVVLPA